MLDELQRRNYSPATTRGYILAIKQFAEYFGKSPECLGREEIRRFELHLLKERKLAPGTVEGRMSALRFLYKKVLKRRDIAYDDLIFPKVPRKLPVVLSPDEITRMIEAAPNLMHRTILLVLSATGIRRAEASLLKVSDIDSERMLIHIHQGKGSRDRDVPMTPKLLETLREYWRWKRPKIYLFPTTEGHRGEERPISDKTVWYACKEAAARGNQEANRTAYATPQLRHPPDGGRNRSANHSASDGPRASGAHHSLSPPVPSPLAFRGEPTRPDHDPDPQPIAKAAGELSGVSRPPW